MKTLEQFLSEANIPDDRMRRIDEKTASMQQAIELQNKINESMDSLATYVKSIGGSIDIIVKTPTQKLKRHF